MGIYMVSVNEIIDDFEKFLQGVEGDLSASELAKAWNLLAKKYEWNDRLIAIDNIKEIVFPERDDDK